MITVSCTNSPRSLWIKTEKHVVVVVVVVVVVEVAAAADQLLE